MVFEQKGGDNGRTGSQWAKRVHVFESVWVRLRSCLKSEVPLGWGIPPPLRILTKAQNDMPVTSHRRCLVRSGSILALNILSFTRGSHTVRTPWSPATHQLLDLFFSLLPVHCPLALAPTVRRSIKKRDKPCRSRAYQTVQNLLRTFSWLGERTSWKSLLKNWQAGGTPCRSCRGYSPHHTLKTWRKG